MLTEKDIRTALFNKTRGGYKVNEVDDFLEQCAQTVAALTSAKADLEKKLEVLADKLVEYRNDEDNIRTALLSAQRLGDTLVREAKHKAGLIMDDARIKAEKLQETAERNIKDQEHELERVQKEVTNFKMRLLSIYREHLALIDVLPELREQEPVLDQPQDTVQAVDTQPADQDAAMDQEASAPTEFEPVEDSSADTSTPVEPNVVIDLPVLEDEDAPFAAADESAQTTAAKEVTQASRFANLKFGDDYDIAKDTDDESGFFKRRK